MSHPINASLAAEFDKFRRAQVSEYLAWQADIVREYARPDQFVTHNFDFEWRGYSYGVQPSVNHFQAARTLDIAGVDIYHPTEDDLTGKEIAFGGDVTRSLKNGANYLVLETQAQGQHGWLPYPGQLRLQAYSHLASGADSVMYWHWHSIHNSFESYWKGLLSHDVEPNPTYDEASVFGQEIARPEIGSHLLHLQKHNKVAIMISNESLTALQWFSLDTGFPASSDYSYNDVVRRVYDALFDLNVECDVVTTKTDFSQLQQYSMVITPALYSAPEQTLKALRAYVEQGGYLIATVRSMVCDEYLKIWHDKAPHEMQDVFGITYNQFTRPQKVGLLTQSSLRDGDQDAFAEGCCQAFMELLNPDIDTTVLAHYLHPVWSSYAAITHHQFGRGQAQWIGTLLDPQAMRQVLVEALKVAGLYGPLQELAGQITVRQGINAAGEQVTYFLNYSDQVVTVSSPYAGRILLGQCQTAGKSIGAGEQLTVDAWNLAIVVGKSTANEV